MAKHTSDPWPEHPLFPAEDGDEPQRIEFIQVIRHENGRALMIPHTFRADELQSTEDIFARWGGGHYELQGRRSSLHDASKLGRLSGNRRYMIPGASLPLVGGQPESPPPTQTAPAMPAQAPSLLSGEISPTLIGLVPVLVQFWQQHTAAREAKEEREAARRREEDERRRQDDIRREERIRQETAENNRLMLQMHAQSQQSQSAITAAVLARGGGGADEFGKVADLVLKLKGGPGIEPAPETGGVLDKLVELAGNAADVVQGAVALKGGGAAGAPAPAGSAAAFMGVSPMKPLPPGGGGPATPPVAP